MIIWVLRLKFLNYLLALNGQYARSFSEDHEKMSEMHVYVCMFTHTCTHTHTCTYTQTYVKVTV